MSRPILQSPAPNVWGPRRTMHFQIAIPESCTDEAAKVANFRKHVMELEAELRNVDRIASRFELASKSRLVAAIVMESSISFLDLAAAMFAPINPAASKAATAGVSAVRATKSSAEYSTGQIDGAQFTMALGQQGLNAVSTVKKLDTVAAQAMLNQAKTQLGAVALVVESTSGASRAEMQQATYTFGKSALLNNLATLGEATKAAGMDKSSAAIKVFGIFDGVISGVVSYQEALSSHFDLRLDDAEWTRNFRQNQTRMLKDLMARTEAALRVAATNLDACLAGAAATPAVSPGT